MQSENPSSTERRLRQIERTIPYLFRMGAILAAFQVVVFLIAGGGDLRSPGDSRPCIMSRITLGESRTFLNRTGRTIQASHLF